MASLERQHGPSRSADRRGRSYRASLIPLASVAGFLLVWYIAAEVAQSRILPGPVEVLRYVVDEALHGDLLAELGITLWRVAASFVVAMVIGSVIGLAHGRDAGRSTACSIPG